MENFRRRAPDHHQPGTIVGLAELRDVFHQHFRFFHLRLGLLDVRPVDPPDVLRIEHRLHRPDGGKRLLQLIQLSLFQHPGLGRGFVSRIFVNVPAAEHQIVQSGQRHKILDLRRPVVGALAQANGGKLRERTHRRGHSALHASTPAINVVVTAPIPGINTPSFPFAGAIWTLSWAAKFIDSLRFARRDLHSPYPKSGARAVAQNHTPCRARCEEQRRT